MASIAATLLSGFLVAVGFAYLAGAFHELGDWRIAAGALLMFAGVIVTRLLPVLYGYESWRGGSHRSVKRDAGAL